MSVFFFNLNIANGRLWMDSLLIEKTCKGVSTIDSVILSPELFTLINHFEILPFDPLLSDTHCGIHFSVRYKNDKSTVNIITDVQNEVILIIKPVWINSEAEIFRENLNSYNIKAFSVKVDRMSRRNDVTIAEICGLTTECFSFLLYAAESAGMLKQVKYSQLLKMPKNIMWSSVHGLMMSAAH